MRPVPTSGDRAGRAFTLTELLVATAVVAVLAALAVSGTQAAISQARKANEASAARNLIVAYLAAADPDSGRLLPGYDRTVGSLPGPGGVPVSGPPAQRYPWRLAPALGDEYRGLFVVGKNAAQIDPDDTYMVSCYPAFGINYIFVGGDIQADGSMTYPGECVTRAAAEASVLVFASACGDGNPGGSGGGKINGYCILTPPNLTGPMWSGSAWSAASSPDDYGNVDPRHNGRAVCAFLDGSVRMESVADLRDMRLWARGAAQANNANYMVADTTQRGGRLH